MDKYGKYRERFRDKHSEKNLDFLNLELLTSNLLKVYLAKNRIERRQTCFCFRLSPLRFLHFILLAASEDSCPLETMVSDTPAEYFIGNFLLDVCVTLL